MMYKISFTQNHLDATAWRTFFDMLFTLRDGHNDKIANDGCFVIHAYDLEPVLDRIGSEWSEHYAKRDEHGVPHGPTLHINVEPITDLRTQFGVKDVNSMDAVVIATEESRGRQQLDALRDILGEDGLVAIGDGISELTALLAKEDIDKQH